MLRQLVSSRRGIGVRELADDYDVSEKTIRRDLDAMAQAGFHLISTSAERGQKRWRIADDSALPAKHLSLTEVAALYLGRRFLEPLAGTSLWSSAQSAFVKLQQQFPRDALTYLNTLAQTIHETSFGISDYSVRAEVIDSLMSGIDESRVTNLFYHPLRSDCPEEYELHPLGLVFNRRTLYLVASSSGRPEPRHFKVDRIRDVTLRDESFERPANFDLQQHLENSLGVYHSSAPLQEVRIRFAADVSRYVTEHRWHHSQQMEEQPDGSLIVTLQLGDLTELKSWVLSFGAQAEVLTPQSLRESIRQEAESLLKLYGHVNDRTSDDHTPPFTQGSMRS